MSIESKRAEVIAEQAAKGLCVCGAPLGGGHHGIADAGGPGVTGYCPLDPNRPSAREERRFDKQEQELVVEALVELSLLRADRETPGWDTRVSPRAVANNLNHIERSARFIVWADMNGSPVA